MNIIKRVIDNSYVIEENGYPYHIPNEGEFSERWAEINAYAEAHPDEVTLENPPEPHEPTEEEIAEAELAKAKAQANTILTAAVFRTAAQTESFKVSEYAVLGKAGMYEEWEPDASYEKGKRLTYNGIVYEVQQQTTSSSVYPPDAEGVLALYRPLSANGQGTLEEPYEWIYGMDVERDEYVTYGGKTYKAISPMKPCTWTPGSDTNVWEEIAEAE